jgi:hypothetical protein
VIRNTAGQTDIAAGSVSPQKLYGVPVGLMFFEGAPRPIPKLHYGDPKRIVVEAYPGVLDYNKWGAGRSRHPLRSCKASGKNSVRGTEIGPFSFVRWCEVGICQPSPM